MSNGRIEKDPITKVRKKEYSESQKEKMKERLKKIAHKKIDTTMVFPLSQFEMEFGHIWGHGKPEYKLTQEEKVNLAKWKRCRNEILNNGNKQKRGISDEIDMHTVIWNRYQVQLIPIQSGPKGENHEDI